MWWLHICGDSLAEGVENLRRVKVEIEQTNVVTWMPHSFSLNSRIDTTSYILCLDPAFNWTRKVDYCKFKFLCKLLSQFYIKNVYSPETASLTWQGNKEITVWYQGSKLACIKWILTHAQYFWKIVHCVRVSFREFWYWEQNASHLVVQCIICHFGYYCIFAFAIFISSCTDISCYCIFCTT